MSNLDKLLASALPSADFKKEIVKHGDVEFEVRQPSRKVRQDLLKKCTDKEGRIDLMDFITWATIYSTYDPESGKRVFSDEHYDSIMSQPSGGLLDKLGEKASELMNVSADLGEEAKNSKKTQKK